MENYNDYYFQILHLIFCRINMMFGSQKKFAQEIGIDRANLSKFLKGKIHLSSKTFVKICSALGIGIFAPIDTKNGFLYRESSF